MGFYIKNSIASDPIPVLREDLRNQACGVAARLYRGCSDAGGTASLYIVQGEHCPSAAGLGIISIYFLIFYIIIMYMHIDFAQHKQNVTLGPLSEGAVTAQAVTGGVSFQRRYTPSTAYAVPLPLWGRQEGALLT